MARGTADGWRDRIRRWHGSGLGVREFCLREGVSEPSFYQWRKRLKAHPASDGDGSAAVFVPVQVVDALPVRATEVCDPADSVVEVVLSGGVTIRGGRLVDESRWRSVLRAVLMETGGC